MKYWNFQFVLWVIILVSVAYLLSLRLEAPVEEEVVEEEPARPSPEEERAETLSLINRKLPHGPIWKDRLARIGARKTALAGAKARVVYVGPRDVTANPLKADGSREKPFRKIAEALNLHSESDRGLIIRLFPGTYREEILYDAGDSGIPLTIEAADRGGAAVIWSGADDYSGSSFWQEIEGHPGLYRHPWNHDWASSRVEVISTEELESEESAVKGPKGIWARSGVAVNESGPFPTVEIKWAKVRGIHKYRVYQRPFYPAAEGGQESSRRARGSRVTRNPVWVKIAEPEEGNAHYQVFAEKEAFPKVRYFDYRVSAVDHDGVESTPSRVVRVEVPSAEQLSLKSQVFQREEVYTKNGSFERVSSLEKLEEGKFFVSDGWLDVYDDGWIYIRSLEHPKHLGIEMTARPSRSKNSLLQIKNANHLTLRGIQFSRAATDQLQGAAVTVSDSYNILVEKCSFVGNRGDGFATEDGVSLTVRKCQFNQNGGSGLVIRGGASVLLDRNETLKNNYGEEHDIEVLQGLSKKHFAGVLVNGGVRDLVLRDHLAERNRCSGIVLEGGMEYVWLEGVTSQFNEGDGLALITGRGPLWVQWSLFAYNEHGLNVANLFGGSVYGNLFHGNSHGDFVIEDEASVEVIDPETGRNVPLQSYEWDVKGNLFSSVDGALPHWSVPWSEGFLQTLQSNHNIFAKKSEMVKLGGVGFSFKEWRSYTAKDFESRLMELPFPESHLGRFPVELTHALRNPKSTEGKFPPVGDAGPEKLGRLLLQRVERNHQSAYPELEPIPRTDFKMLNIRTFANRRIQGNRYRLKDTWVGETLDQIPLGQVKIHGIPFDVIDPKRNRLLSGVMFANESFKNRRRDFPEEVVIPVGRAVDTLCALHVAADVHQSLGTVAEFVVVYEGGSEEVLALHRLRSGESEQKDFVIQSWMPEGPHVSTDYVKPVLVMHSDELPPNPRYLYTLRWPLKDKQTIVRELRVRVSEKSAAIYMLLSLTILESK